MISRDEFELIQYSISSKGSRDEKEALNYLLNNSEIIDEFSNSLKSKTLQQLSNSIRELACGKFRSLYAEYIKRKVDLNSWEIANLNKINGIMLIDALTMLDTDETWSYHGSIMPTYDKLWPELCDHHTAKNGCMIKKAFEKHEFLLKQLHDYDPTNEYKFRLGHKITLHQLLRTWNHALFFHITEILKERHNIEYKITDDNRDTLLVAENNGKYAGAAFPASTYLSSNELVENTTMVCGLKNIGYTFALWAIADNENNITNVLRIYAGDESEAKHIVNSVRNTLLAGKVLKFADRVERFGPFIAAVNREETLPGETSVLIGNDQDNSLYSTIPNFHRIATIPGGLGIFAVRDEFIESLTPFLYDFLNAIKHKDLPSITKSSSVITHANRLNKDVTEKKLNEIAHYFGKYH